MNSSNPPPPPDPLFPPQRFPPPKPPAGTLKRRAAKKPDFSGLPEDAPEPCSECGKQFASSKALFGHMRCHPEREWRGINPPPNARRAKFTDEERQVASTLVLLASGPSPESASGELKSKKRKSFGDQFSPSSSSSCFCSEDECLLDLNLPPPLESEEGGSSPDLELKLGFE